MERDLHKAIYLACIVCTLCGALSAQSQHVTAVREVQPEDSTSLPVNADSLQQAAIKRYYHLALQYKDGDSVGIDYQKAFYYFSKAAELGDAQSKYGLGYMHYKGLGTAQDYVQAASLFSQGAYQGRDNSMYFYGLCLRNGYGVLQNEDSAQYWLKKSAALGYKQATLELQSKAPENGNGPASQLIQRIHNAAIPEQIPLNQFIAIQPQTPDSSIIAGNYEGYLIQYDWSGRHPVGTKKLHVFFEQASNRTLTGKWMEEDADTVSVNASLEKDSLVFAGTSYKRKDHYSLSQGVAYDFKNASLNFVRKSDSVFLAGNIYMFSPDRKEPSKPLFVALARTADISQNGNNKDSSLVKKQNNDLSDSSKNTLAAKLLSIYPNPFTTYLNVEFKVNEPTTVSIELYNMVGQKVYAKPSQPLNNGTYKIRIEPSLQLAAQTYLLRLVFSNGQEVVKVIKK